MRQHPPYIAVIGAGEATPEVATAAEEVGKHLAAGGAVLVCGGLGGVMEAACRGAKSAGGTTVGILPGYGRLDANAYVDIALPTGIGEARNTLVVRSADAVVAVAGEFGTLSEIGFALKIGVPVVGLDTWELHKRGAASEAIIRASSAEEAVALALSLARG